MLFLILGLVLFLGVHSIRIFADDWRTAQRNKIGEMPWKGIYSLVSLVGFGVLVWGYGLARHETTIIWSPPVFMRHIAALLVLVAFIFLVATYVPGNSIKARVHHPMVLAVKTWAFAHLLANGTLADIILFASFLVWAMLSFRAARKRDRVTGTSYPPGTMGATLVTVVVGIAAFVGFALWGHAYLIGVRPFG